jgi:hypothetical protein
VNDLIKHPIRFNPSKNHAKFPNERQTHALPNHYFPTTNLDPIPFAFLCFGLFGTSRFGDEIDLVGVVVGVTILFLRFRLPSDELFPNSWTTMISLGLPCFIVGSIYVPNNRSPIISVEREGRTKSEEGLRKVCFDSVCLMMNVMID